MKLGGVRNLALAGRRLNHIFMDSYNKFSRLTLKKWENKNKEFRFTNLVSFYIPRDVPNSQLIKLWTDLLYLISISQILKQ